MPPGPLLVRGDLPSTPRDLYDVESVQYSDVEEGDDVLSLVYTPPERRDADDDLDAVGQYFDECRQAGPAGSGDDAKVLTTSPDTFAYEILDEAGQVVYTRAYRAAAGRIVSVALLDPEGVTLAVDPLVEKAVDRVSG